MMSDKSIRAGTARKFMAITMLALVTAACGGGGGGSGGGVAVIPPPPPPPPPAAASPIIPAATTSQQFATAGAAYTTPLASYSEIDVSLPSLSDESQLDVRYDATTQKYEIQLPTDAAWFPIFKTATVTSGAGNLIDLYRATGSEDFGAWNFRAPPNLQYSALFQWFTDSASGYSAVGIPTPVGSMPVSGSASYAGFIQGSGSQTALDPWEAVWVVDQIYGTINLNFNFGSGTLTGDINPFIGDTALPALSFANTVYSTGSTTFAGAFQTQLPGINSFSGRFTGPAAQELIGNFAFPYSSPAGTQQAAGAFVGSRP